MIDDGFDPEAWRSFCERLATVGARLADDPFPAAGADHALCVRHLLRQVVMAAQSEIEFGDAASPAFHRYEEPWVQWGGPNPDNLYTRAPIDPAATYRVFGNVAGVRAALFSLVDGDMHLGRFGVFSEQALADLEVAPDGTIELWISPDPHDGNWFATDPEARLFLVRQYLADWEHDARARLTIERVDTRGVPPAPLDPASFTDALDRAATWIERSLEFWCTYVERARDSLPHNAVSPPSTPKGGAPSIAYGAGWWELAPDDALLITTDLPDADYWGWTVHHRFRLDSGDFASRQTSLNMMQTVTGDDARVHLVVAAGDPGVPNWIDTEGQPEGMLVYRSIGTRTRPNVECRVVPLADVRGHLPASHPLTTPTERRASLARRRAAVLGRYA